MRHPKEDRNGDNNRFAVCVGDGDISRLRGWKAYHEDRGRKGDRRRKNSNSRSDGWRLGDGFFDLGGDNKRAGE